MLLWIEAFYVFFRCKTRLHSVLFLNCFTTLINNLGYLFVMTAHTPEESLLAVKFSYFGKVWIPFSMFIFAMEICNIKLDKRIYTGLGVMHVGTFFLVLTNEYNDLYYTSRVFSEEGLFPHYVFGHGVWYYIYFGIMAVYIVVGLGLLVVTTIREKRAMEKNVCFLYCWR